MAEPVVSLVDLTRSFHLGDTEVKALRGVNLRIDRGEFVAIMGSSGSGKSTLMNLIGCLDRPTSGQYIFEGRDVARLSEPELATSAAAGSASSSRASTCSPAPARWKTSSCRCCTGRRRP